MSLFTILNIGRTGMAASAFGATNASQNAANVATDGYSRRMVRLEPIGPDPLGGVRALGARRIQDRFIERQLLGATSGQGFTDGRIEALRTLDDAFTDASGSLEDALAAFQTATSGLAASPKDAAARSVFLEQAKRLAEAFQRTAGQVEAARDDANARIADGVAEVNARLDAIGTLAEEIARSEATGGEASDLRDRRDQLLRELSSYLPISLIELSDGRVDVLLAGSRTLVDRDGRVKRLEASLDTTTGDLRVLRDSSYDDEVTGLLTTGKLGGLIEARDGALTEAGAALDALASELVAAYNGVHVAGFGLDGVSGRNLFEPVSGVGAALAMRVSSDVSDDPRALAAAEDPTELPGDNRVALAIEALAEARVATGGTQTIVEALASLVGRAGSFVRSAEFEQERATDVVSQVESLRQSVSGVVTDEEMIDLTRFQRAFQASARVVQTADEMLADIVNLKR